MSKRTTIKILIGIPASGKTTWAKEFVNNNPGWIRVSRDDYRFMLQDKPILSYKLEGMITEMVENTIELALSKKLSVVIDNCHTVHKHIKEISDKFQYSADIEYKVFDTPLETALERDKNRDRIVGENVINRMYKQYKNLFNVFDFQPITKKRRPYIIPEVTVDNPAVIFDIDGTLAQSNNRSPYDTSKVDQDYYVDIVIEQIKYHKSKGRRIILFSGREDSCKDLTIKWLNDYNNGEGILFDELHMRKAEDNRKDSVIKKELYNNHVNGKYNVIAVYDDRLQVLDMWNKLGLFVFNVNQGNHIF